MNTSFSDHATVTGHGRGSRGAICSSSVEKISVRTVHSRKSSTIWTPRSALTRSPDPRRSGTKAAVPSTTSKRREPWVAAGEPIVPPLSLLTSSLPAARHRTPRSHPVRMRTPMLLARAVPIRWRQNHPSSGRRDEGVVGLVRPGSVRPNRQRRESWLAVAVQVVRHGALSRSVRKPRDGDEEVGRHPAMRLQTR